MSGVGKTTLANMLRDNGWFHYSGDYRLGTRYLNEAILDNIKLQAMQVPFLRDLLRSDSLYIENNITVDHLKPLSAFLGKLGNPELGGLGLTEFKRRQRLHHTAEVAAMMDVPDFINRARNIYGYNKFINDVGGSLCELDEPGVMELLADNTMLVYIRTNQYDEKQLIERAEQDPKPLYYREEFLDEQLALYRQEKLVDYVAMIDPDDFIKRGPAAQAHIDEFYEDFETIKQAGLDGLIITGANVTQPDLASEVFWEPLKEVYQWASENVTSVLCSCLASHAVLQFLYGIKRRHLGEKMWGVFRHTVEDRTHPLVNDVNTLFDVPHSRFNEVSTGQLKSAGLHVLVESKQAGVHLAVEAVFAEYRERVEEALQNTAPLPVFPEPEVTPFLHNTWHDTGEAVVGNWVGLVYQLTSSERSKPFMDGVDVNDPLAWLK
ncbi:unnamed protein product [Cyprideis torosa]|uniref:Uncharacterized protein n=1 Tax=Cyprideis torosa TaxID=163714 RepID=A0A7R8W2Q0_9CRUS|nr:unnamed protein product [Cyprideis torosa]CAG0878791.1 unnamed protein product [Cyprideis torosa]